MTKNKKIIAPFEELLAELQPDHVIFVQQQPELLQRHHNIEHGAYAACRGLNIPRTYPGEFKGDPYSVQPLNSKILPVYLQGCLDNPLPVERAILEIANHHGYRLLTRNPLDKVVVIRNRKQEERYFERAEEIIKDRNLDMRIGFIDSNEWTYEGKKIR